MCLAGGPSTQPSPQDVEGIFPLPTREKAGVRMDVVVRLLLTPTLTSWGRRDTPLVSSVPVTLQAEAISRLQHVGDGRGFRFDPLCPGDRILSDQLPGVVVYRDHVLWLE